MTDTPRTAPTIEEHRAVALALLDLLSGQGKLDQERVTFFQLKWSEMTDCRELSGHYCALARNLGVQLAALGEWQSMKQAHQMELEPYFSSSIPRKDTGEGLTRYLKRAAQDFLRPRNVFGNGSRFDPEGASLMSDRALPPPSPSRTPTHLR